MSGLIPSGRSGSRTRPLASPPRAAAPPRAILPYALAAGALAVTLGTHLADFGLDDSRTQLFNAASEWSFSHILATVAFAAGALAGRRGRVADRARRGGWTWVCALFAFLLLDNVTRLHEHIPAWPVLYAPVLLGLLVAIARVARGTPQERVVRAGMCLLAISLAIHIFGPAAERALGWGPTAWGYQVKIGLKEATELAAWTLLVPALWVLARARGGGLRPSRRLYAA